MSSMPSDGLAVAGFWNPSPSPCRSWTCFVVDAPVAYPTPTRTITQAHHDRMRAGPDGEEAAFLPPQATIPAAAAMEDEDAFWSAMHDDVEHQQQPSSAPGPSLPRLSLPRFTQLRGPDDDAPSLGSLLMPPAPGPSTSGHSSSSGSSSSSTGGSGGNGGQRRKSQQGASIGVGGLAGMKQGVGELLRAIAGSAGGIVYHAEASEGGRRGRSHPRSTPSAMMGGPSSSSYLELNRHAGDGFHYQRMEGEGEGSPLRPEDEEDDEDEEDGVCESVCVCRIQAGWLIGVSMNGC